MLYDSRRSDRESVCTRRSPRGRLARYCAIPVALSLTAVVIFSLLLPWIAHIQQPPETESDPDQTLEPDNAEAGESLDVASVESDSDLSGDAPIESDAASTVKGASPTKAVSAPSATKESGGTLSPNASSTAKAFDDASSAETASASAVDVSSPKPASAPPIDRTASSANAASAPSAEELASASSAEAASTAEAMIAASSPNIASAPPTAEAVVSASSPNAASAPASAKAIIGASSANAVSAPSSAKAFASASSAEAASTPSAAKALTGASPSSTASASLTSKAIIGTSSSNAVSAPSIAKAIASASSAEDASTPSKAKSSSSLNAASAPSVLVSLAGSAPKSIPGASSTKPLVDASALPISKAPVLSKVNVPIGTLGSEAASVPSKAIKRRKPSEAAPARSAVNSPSSEAAPPRSAVEAPSSEAAPPPSSKAITSSNPNRDLVLYTKSAKSAEKPIVDASSCIPAERFPRAKAASASMSASSKGKEKICSSDFEASSSNAKSFLSTTVHESRSFQWLKIFSRESLPDSEKTSPDTPALPFIALSVSSNPISEANDDACSPSSVLDLVDCNLDSEINLPLCAIDSLSESPSFGDNCVTNSSPSDCKPLLNESIKDTPCNADESLCSSSGCDQSQLAICAQNESVKDSPSDESLCSSSGDDESQLAIWAQNESVKDSPSDESLLSCSGGDESICGQELVSLPSNSLPDEGRPKGDPAVRFEFERRVGACLEQALGLYRTWSLLALSDHMTSVEEFVRDWVPVYWLYPEIAVQFEKVGDAFLRALLKVDTMLYGLDQMLDFADECGVVELFGVLDHYRARMARYAWYGKFLRQNPVYYFWSSALRFHLRSGEELEVRHLEPDDLPWASLPIGESSSSQQCTIDRPKFHLKSLRLPGKSVFRNNASAR